MVRNRVRRVAGMERDDQGPLQRNPIDRSPRQSQNPPSVGQINKLKYVRHLCMPNLSAWTFLNLEFQSRILAEHGLLSIRSSRNSASLLPTVGLGAYRAS